jgi:hypothetical protein
MTYHPGIAGIFAAASVVGYNLLTTMAANREGDFNP